ncbi:MAG: hypothetical protein HY981_04395 [Candidatus Magasanikbacteria bacterium]|nr:hypothetical protein [Candidatus Magasanikbacteria bacterium]
MKTRTMIFWVVLMAVSVAIIILILRNTLTSKKISARPNVAASASLDAAFESRVDEQRGVNIEVTPAKIELNVPLQFDINLSTHTVDLDDDLVKQSILLDDQSNEYKPVSWTGSGPGGHHRSGTLFFAPFNTIPRYFELRIRDIGEAPERVFKWNVK